MLTASDTAFAKFGISCFFQAVGGELETPIKWIMSTRGEG